MPKSVVISQVQRQWQNHGTHTLILGYALTIHKLQGATCDKVILNLGPKEFALELLLVVATSTKTYENLAFHPFPDYEGFQQVGKRKAFLRKIEAEERESRLEESTMERFAHVFEQSNQDHNRNVD